MAALAPLHPLYHLGALTAVIALALRGQLQLRIVLLASLLLYIADEYLGTSPPAWPYIAWNALFAVINGMVMVELILDRTTVGLAAADKDLYRGFPTLTPGEFRKLLRLAERVTAAEPVRLTTEGETPAYLYCVLEGELDILKHGRRIAIEPPTFIGEIAYLRGGGASATVELKPGGRMLRWPVVALAAHLSRHVPLKVAFNRLISDDLALKVANG